MNLKQITLTILVCINFSAIAEEKPAIGLISDLSGHFQELGVDCKNGYKIAELELEKVYRDKLSFIYEDSQSVGKSALTAFKRTLNHNLIAAIGFGSHAGLGINPTSKQLGVPFIALSGHPRFLSENKYAFSIWTETTTESEIVAEAMHKKGYKKLALLTLEHDYFLSVRDQIKGRFYNLGGEVVFDQTFTADFNDFKTIVLKLMQAKADVVFFLTSPSATVTALKQLHEADFKGGKFSLTSNFKEEVFESAGIGPSEGLTYVVVKFNQPTFRSLFEKHFPSKSLSPYTYACYAGTKLLVDKIKELSDDGIEITRENVYRKLMASESVSLPDSEVKIKDRRLTYKYQLLKISNGKLTG